MITKATFDFLKDLAQNNNREWFHDHKNEHDLAKQNVLDFVQQVINKLGKTEPLIPQNLEAKNCVMRIYRDIRFSKDKTPYKTNFGAGISPNGKNFNGPGYYLHISPEGCFVAGGCWMPEAENLKLIRQEIDYNASSFREIIEDPDFKSYFVEPDRENLLKTSPKGYPADHPEIEFLKLKSFTVSHEINSAELSNKNSVDKVVEGFEKMHPFMIFLRNALS
ncbi:MAG: DUF2461 domain-containing protein [Daejeonella sp.]